MVEWSACEMGGMDFVDNKAFKNFWTHAGSYIGSIRSKRFLKKHVISRVLHELQNVVSLFTDVWWKQMCYSCTFGGKNFKHISPMKIGSQLK